MTLLRLQEIAGAEDERAGHLLALPIGDQPDFPLGGVPVRAVVCPEIVFGRLAGKVVFVHLLAYDGRVEALQPALHGLQHLFRCPLQVLDLHFALRQLLVRDLGGIVGLDDIHAVLFVGVVALLVDPKGRFGDIPLLGGNLKPAELFRLVRQRGFRRSESRLRRLGRGEFLQRRRRQDF